MQVTLTHGVSLLSLVLSRVGPVDKSKNSAETRSFSGRTQEPEIEKDGIYHPIKV